jgi:hypothetical protein
VADATRYQINEDALAGLPPDKRRVAIRALAEMHGGVRRNPLFQFDPLDPRGMGIPHIPQDAWLRSHHTPDGDPVKFRLAPGGNRGGKTTTGDLSVIIDCTPSEILPPHLQAYKRWEPPIQVYLVAVSGRAITQIHLPIFRQWCPKDILVGGSFEKAFNKEYQTLHFKDGSMVNFMSQGMDVEVFQGVPRHIVHFDEEPLYDHGRAIFTECLQRLVDFDGDMRMTFTPLNGMTWVYDTLWQPWEQQQPDRETAKSGFAAIEWEGEKFPIYGHRFEQDDNPVIDPRGKAAALALARNDEERRARKSGLFVSMAGRVFEGFSRQRHVVPDDVVLEHLHDKRTLQLLLGGLDPGFRHMAAAIFVGLDDEGVWVGPEVICEKTVIASVAAQIQVVAAEFKLELPIFVADPAIERTDHQTGLTDRIAYHRAGIATRLGINDVRPGINAIRGLCDTNRIHIMAGNEVLIDQMLRLRWKTTGRSEDAAPERPVKRDDHATDALRYPIMSLPIPEARVDDDKRTRMQKILSEDVAQAVRARSESPTEYGDGYWQ